MIFVYVEARKTFYKAGVDVILFFSFFFSFFFFALSTLPLLAPRVSTCRTTLLAVAADDTGVDGDAAFVFAFDCVEARGAAPPPSPTI